MTRLLDTLWGRFCAHLQDHEFAHENERWTIRAGQRAWSGLFGRGATDPRRRLHAMADLLLAALEGLVARPDELPSADALMIARDGGDHGVVVTPTLARIDRQWRPDLRVRSERSREI